MVCVSPASPRSFRPPKSATLLFRRNLNGLIESKEGIEILASVVVAVAVGRMRFRCSPYPASPRRLSSPSRKDSGGRKGRRRGGGIKSKICKCPLKKGEKRGEREERRSRKEGTELDIEVMRLLKACKDGRSGGRAQG